MPAAHPLSPPEFADLCTQVALLDLPCRLEMDGDTCVIHLPCTASVAAEVTAMRLVEKRTDAFRCSIKVPA